MCAFLQNLAAESTGKSQNYGVEINLLKPANILLMYRSPGLQSPLLSKAENRGSIFAGTYRWLLQIRVSRGRVSHLKWRLICVQIFGIPITSGLEVKLTKLSLQQGGL